MALFNFEDHTSEIKALTEQAIKTCLDTIGQTAEGDVVKTIKAKGIVSTGAAGLSGSMTHTVKDHEVHIGSPLEYAIYHEVGTGVHAEGGKGRKGWWVYVEGGGKKGRNTHKTYSYEEARKIMAILRAQGLDAHMTQGVRASHFLKESIEGNLSEYNRIMEVGLERALGKFAN